jgi:predicted enzyme related to lactoylglutathione lyase
MSWGFADTRSNRWDRPGRPRGPYTGIVASFPVNGVDSAPARAQSLGGNCVLEPTHTPMSRIAVFTEPTATASDLFSR